MVGLEKWCCSERLITLQFHTSSLFSSILCAHLHACIGPWVLPNTGDLHSMLCLIASYVDTGAAAAMLITCCSSFASCVGVTLVTSAGMPGWRNDWPLSGIVTEVWNFTQSADIVEVWREKGFERPCKCMRHIRMTDVFDWTCQKIVHVVKKVVNLAVVLLVKDWAFWKEYNNPSVRFVNVMIYDFT